jgi:hypothetical protein
MKKKIKGTFKDRNFYVVNFFHVLRLEKIKLFYQIDRVEVFAVVHKMQDISVRLDNVL